MQFVNDACFFPFLFQRCQTRLGDGNIAVELTEADFEIQKFFDLFESLFARALDRDENALTFLAMDARRLGLLDIKSGGGMTVVSFDAILSEKEKRLIHGAH